MGGPPLFLLFKAGLWQGNRQRVSLRRKQRRQRGAVELCAQQKRILRQPRAQRRIYTVGAVEAVHILAVIRLRQIGVIEHLKAVPGKHRLQRREGGRDVAVLPGLLHALPHRGGVGGQECRYLDAGPGAESEQSFRLGKAFCVRRFAVLKAVRVFCDALERILKLCVHAFFRVQHGGAVGV